MTKRQDLIVIGGGPGGLVVASVASQLGLRVTLIEKSDRLGGDCLHLSLIHISEPTRPPSTSRMPSSA